MKLSLEPIGRGAPAGMSAATWQRIGRLRDGVRLQVLERAAIIQEATGCSWVDADERAMAEEAGAPTQRTLGGGP